jgi:outer membrane biosynthesis protein TonB
MPVHVAVRSYVSTGVAMIGATAVIAAPVAVPPQEIHLPAIHASSATVELAALANPIAEWVNVIQNTFTNVAALGQQFQNDPAPILQQILKNQLANATTLSDALTGAAGGLVGQLTALPAATLTAAQQLAAGQFSTAVSTLFQAGIGLILAPTISLLSLPNIVTNTVQNFANVVAAIPNILLPVGLAAISPLAGVVYSFGDTGQAVIDSLRAGDLAGAVSALVNAPAALADAFLNGYAAQNTVGILSPGAGFAGGLVAALLNARDTIAQALGAAAPVTATASVAALPAASKLVSLAPMATNSSAGAGEGAAATTATETTATETTATAPQVPTTEAATEPVTAASSTPVAATTAESPSQPAESVSSATSTPTAVTTKDAAESESTKPASTSTAGTTTDTAGASTSPKPSGTSATAGASSSGPSSASGTSSASAGGASKASDADKPASSSAGAKKNADSKKDAGASSSSSDAS